MTKEARRHRRFGTGVARLVLAAAALAYVPSLAAAEPDDDRRDGAERTAESSDRTRALRELRREFPWAGEQFFYSLRVNGKEALRASFKAGDIAWSKDGDPYVPLGLSLHSLGFFDNVYPVDDRADTFIDPRTMLPYRTHKHFREAGDFRTYIVAYDHDDYRARVQRSNAKRTERFKNAIPRTTFDMISWLYHFRRREISLDETYRYYIYDGWDLSLVHLEVVDREDLHTPAGRFKSWKIRFVRRTMDSKRNNRGPTETAPIVRVDNPREHTGYFWLSRDQNHLPLRITIPTEFGAGEAVLIEYDRPERR